MSRVAIRDRYRLKPRNPIQPCNFGSREYLHICYSMYAIDQVSRERALQRVATNDESDLRGKGSKMKCRLPCRVSTTHHEGMLVRGKRSLTGAGAIVQTGSDVVLFLRQTEARVFDAGRTDASARDNPGAVSKVADLFPRQEFAANSFACQKNLGSKATRLFPRTLGQFRATDSLGKSK